MKPLEVKVGPIQAASTAAHAPSRFRPSRRLSLFLASGAVVLFIYLKVSLESSNPMDIFFKSTQSGRVKRQSSPNILFIMTDQQRFDAIRRVQEELPYYKNVTKIRTPNLDKLSRDGVYFRNAYTQCSVCGPARASLRSGCTIERTGLQTNELSRFHSKSPWFDKRVKELVGLDKVLTSLGYNNEYYGKWHLPTAFWKYVKYNNYDHRWKRFTLEKRWWIDILGKYRRFLKVHERSGDISRKLIDGMQLDPWDELPYFPIELDSRYDSPTGTLLKEKSGFASMDIKQPSVNGVATLDSAYSNSNFIADASIRALKRLRAQDKPFFLTVSFVAPHPPMIAFSDYWQYYKEHKENLFVSHNYLDTMNNSAYGQIAKKQPKYQNYTIIQEWTSVYYAMIEEIDDLVGDILKELGDERNNTLIVYTSDHGEMLGAHGKREKNTFYEESNRIPLFMSFPGVIEAGTVVNELVSHLDVYGTIMDYVGLSAYDDSDGTSLRSKIEKRSYNENYDEKFVVAEWDFRDPEGKQKRGAPVLNQQLQTYLAFMVRKGPYKLMLRKDSKSQRMDMMFDLDKDPFEMNNLLGHNAHITSVKTKEKAEHLRCLLLEWMHRMDGGDKHYYSDPAANGGDGLGDIEEVRLRQSWPALDFWKSDSRIEMGRPVWNGTHYVRNEYLYFGRRTPGRGVVKRIRLVGDSMDLFRLEVDGKRSLHNIVLKEKECVRLRICLAAEEFGTQLSQGYNVSVKLEVANDSEGDGIEHLVWVGFATDIGK